ncbi:hypothetical protein ABEW34_01815 [Paenibacillus algorifonticola]|uniref:hypothetical protein n=1 Tax=Paenibacillus algorifonticola TaxID=684063 RepID=UPI003D2D1397
MDNVALTAAKHRHVLMQRHFPQGLTPDTVRLMDEVQELLVKAYISGKEAAAQVSPQSWSNQSCFGYTLMAAEKVGLSDHDTGRMVSALHRIFDSSSLEEAAERYIKSPY